MTTLTDSLRAIRAWQVVVLVAVPLIVAGAVYGVYAWTTQEADDGLTEEQQLIPVQRGDLVNDVSINGSLVYSERETLSFGSQGTLGRIVVEEGQAVAANEVLATLDDASIGSLEKAVAEAEVALQDAKDALESLKEPPASDIAKAGPTTAPSPPRTSSGCPQAASASSAAEAEASAEARQAEEARRRR